MGGLGVNVLFFSSLFYLFIFLFNCKKLEWHYLLHTSIAMIPVSRMLWNGWGDWFDIENYFHIFGFCGTIIITPIFILILTQQNRKSYSELLKKEIWGEWAKYQDK